MNFPRIKAFYYCLAAIAGVVACIGCQQSTAEPEHIVYHHKPADFKEAILRLQAIHESIVASTPLPAPRRFATEDHHDHEHHDHDAHDHDAHETNHLFAPDELEDTKETVEIGIFDELSDVARWLPSIAADSDLPKKSWEEIRRHSRQLDELLTLLKSVDPDQRRAEYCEHADQFQSTLHAMQSLLENFDNWDRKFP